MAKVIKRSNTGKQLRRRELIGSLIYDGFIRESERRPVFKLRNEEKWDRTNYVLELTLLDEWENLLYSVGEIVEETWNLTQYTPIFIPLQPGYMQISEPWELSVHNTYLFMDEEWSFDTEYVFNSFTEQFYEEWDS